jgi:hypothetical protein
MTVISKRGLSVAMDFTTQPIPLPRGNDPLFIVGNGNASTRSNAFEVSNNGHSIVYHNNGAANSAISGARYIDNTPIAWGRVNAVTAPMNYLVESFGVSSAVWGTGGGLNPSTCTITLNYVDPYTGNQVPISNGSCVVATLEDDGTGEYCTWRIFTKPVTWNGTHNQVIVRTFKYVLTQNFTTKDILQDCQEIPADFMITIFGRP